MQLIQNGFNNLLCNSAPVDDSRSDNIVQLEDDETIGQVWIDPVDVRVNTQGVHPVAVSLLFAGLLDQVKSLKNNIIVIIYVNLIAHYMKKKPALPR